MILAALILVALVGVTGLAIGSFLNVVVYRVPAGMSVVHPRSACPNCGHEISARENIPVLSWLLLRGKCSGCATPISKRYPLVELAAAAAFVLVGIWAAPTFASASGAPTTIAAVLRLGAACLVIVDKQAARAAALAVRLNEHFGGARATAGAEVAAALDGASGLIQATPVGMAKMPGVPLPEELLRPAMWISEIVYVPLETPLLKAARRIGCATADGGHMNVGQAVGGFKLFTGLDADPVRMDAHFRRLVAA